MKKSNILKLIVVAAIACVTVLACIAFAACGGDKKAELVGTYKEYHTTNHNTSGGSPEAMQLGYQHEYTLELYSDNSYKMEYNAFYAIAQMTGNSNRTVIQYGTYTAGESSEEGTAVYNLSAPTRIVFFAMNGGSNGAPTQVTAYADTDNWASCSPLDESGFFSYTLTSRSTMETYETAKQFLNTIGREYKVTVQTGELHRMTVEVTSNGGKNINGYDNIIVSDEK